MGEVDTNVGAIQIAAPSDNKTQRITYIAGTGGTNLPQYVGMARAGSAEGDAVWQIKKLIYSGNDCIQVLFCDGNAKYDNTWTNYASHSYS
jgi:hypothetical protein